MPRVLTSKRASGQVEPLTWHRGSSAAYGDFERFRARRIRLIRRRTIAAEVLSGVIAQLDDEGGPRRSGSQADLMLVDTLDFPVLLRSGSTAVVVPDSVRAVVEVKSSLARPPSRTGGDAGGGDDEEIMGTTETLLDALVQIGRLRLAGRDGGRSVRDGGTQGTALLSYGAPVYPRRLRE